jgi:sterol desaturase/sphingolipid hydroxylase (fatty acid hydroxylase superfamily)
MESFVMPDTVPAWIDLLGAALGALLAIFLPIELFKRWRAGRLNRSSILEMLASISPLIPTLMINSLVIGFITLVFGIAASLQPWSIKTTPFTAVLAVLLVDFLYYIDHRCGHRIRLYWAISHSVHHSSPQYDQTTGLRISFIDGFLSPWFYLPAVMIGFDPMLVAASLGFILAYQQWIHTETIGKLRWLDPWLNTPSNHRVHHGSQPQYLDKNYGAVLMVWDRLFGSYEPENEPVQYGLTQAIGSHHPIAVHFCEWIRLWRDLCSVKNFRELLLILWREPDWWHRYQSSH